MGGASGLSGQHVLRDERSLEVGSTCCRDERKEKVPGESGRPQAPR